nr:MAG: internal scaffolding protein [Microvirus sp.]
MFIKRTQADTEKQFLGYSDEAVVVCDPSEDRARQEFKDECDVNVILRRFGAGGFEARPVVYGIQDTDLDLQGVYLAAEAAEAGWLRLPEKLRRRYPGWPELLAAVDRGEASLVDSDGVVQDLPKVVPPAPVVP